MSLKKTVHSARVQSRAWGKTVIYQSWWMVVFLGGCFLIYSQSMKKKEVTAEALQHQLNALSTQKENLLHQHEDLVLQINSQSDPAWIQLTLMKGLGVVPDGQLKVFFHQDID